MVYQNSEITKQTFTESEIKTLKDIAKGKTLTDQDLNSEKVEIIISKDQEINVKREESERIQEKLKEKLLNLKRMLGNIKISLPDDFKHSDQVKFEQFSEIASPEMIAMEHTVQNKTQNLSSSEPKKEVFKYRKLPVVPFVAPRTKKLKIINFTKKIDSEIFQLLKVFEQLNLQPDKLDIHRINNLLNESITIGQNNEDLLDHTSLRFQILEDLKDAIIYVPLKPPMLYYYVSSPYGFRIHPKSKR